MKRSKHNLSCHRLTTMDMGALVPIGLTQVLPGDTFQHATSALIRVSPLLAPVMHPVQVRIHHWFVPHRLVWDDFEDFITGGPDGLNASVLPTKTIAAGAGSNSTLMDYLGVPPSSAVSRVVNALPFRGYNLIWNEYYRDQDLQTEAVVSTASGSDTTTGTSLLNVCWEKDYFTLCRADTQKGADVSIPLGTTAPVVTNNQPFKWIKGDGVGGEARYQQSVIADTIHREGGTPGGAAGVLQWGTESGLRANLTSATAATINDLRQAFALQSYAEARMLYGSRYTEYARYLGVRSSDSRLQRPEYLGGGKQTIQFSEVLQTGVDSGDDGVGTLRGHGIAGLRSNRYRRFFEEHGYVHTFMSVRPKTMYSQGLAKHWKYDTKEDFWQRELQHIGQAEVLNREVYVDHASPTGVFGYMNRYDEYRRQESSVHGDFRSTLNYWHMGRIFASDPALNSTFVKCEPTTRIFADTSSDPLWVMVRHSLAARRLVSKHGNPKGGIF